jgi:hypothetical protein
MKLSALLVALSLASTAAAQTSLVVTTGSTVVYDTGSGPLLLEDLIIQPGGTLRVVGVPAFRVRALGTVRIDGLLDLSGFSNPGVNTLNTTNIPELGAAGGPGAGRGGTGSPLTTQSSPAGTPGFGPLYFPREGGRGGESGLSSPLTFAPDARRPGGGGGGVLAANQPVNPDPFHPSNLGLIARSGNNGWPTALGVLSLTPPPLGGAVGESAFSDADPSNDFFGMRVIPGTGILQVGELQAPVAGSGGGGGGDAINGGIWPPPVFTPVSDEKGAGGGGGGGLGILVAARITVGPLGKIRCDGGKGGGGENTNFLDRVGGGSGGGSGGYLILQARTVDLGLAGDRALTALGGKGGEGAQNSSQPTAINAGGNGGPGVIAIHVPLNSPPLLPVGKTLTDLSAPTALVLLPDRRL